MVVMDVVNFELLVEVKVDVMVVVDLKENVK